MTQTDFADFLPIDPIDVVYAFGATDKELRRLAPMYEGYHRNSCPEAFKRGDTLWSAVVSQWFFGGLKDGDRFVPKDGIDQRTALRHVGAIICSFEPDHGSKEAICAFLLSLWFVDFEPSAEHADAFRAKCKRLRVKAAA